MKITSAGLIPLIGICAIMSQNSYALDIGANVFEIAWGTGMSTSSGNRKYQISYKIEDVITSYYDCQEFYWKFIEEGKNAIPVKHLTGKITLPQILVVQ